MPYKSLKQERYFNANRDKLERQGVDVDEWNQASKGLDLPMKTTKSTLGGKTFTHHPGRLHEEMGIPEGEKIGVERERKALHAKNSQERRDARAALGYAAMRKK